MINLNEKTLRVGDSFAVEVCSEVKFKTVTVRRSKQVTLKVVDICKGLVKIVIAESDPIETLSGT